MQRSLHESLIDRCSPEASVSRERRLSGQESPVARLDGDRWRQQYNPTSWIKREEMWHWKIAWVRSLIWSNGPGSVSSSLSGGGTRAATWLSFLTSLEITKWGCGMQNAENNWSCLINLKRAPAGFLYTNLHANCQVSRVLSRSYLPVLGR